MKFIQVLSIATLSALVTGKVQIDDLTGADELPVIIAGSVHTLHWKISQNYTLSIQLAESNESGDVVRLGPYIRGRMFWPAGHGKLNWTVPSNASEETPYSILISGMSPDGPERTAVNHTSPFLILGFDGNLGSTVEPAA